MENINYEKEIAYIDKQLKKAKIHFKSATKQNDPIGAENLKNTISILENIKRALGGDKTIINCPNCGSMYEKGKEHVCK